MSQSQMKNCRQSNQCQISPLFFSLFIPFFGIPISKIHNLDLSHFHHRNSDQFISDINRYRLKKMQSHSIFLPEEEWHQPRQVQYWDALFELEYYEGGEEYGEIEDVEYDLKHQIKHDFSYAYRAAEQPSGKRSGTDEDKFSYPNAIRN